MKLKKPYVRFMASDGEKLGRVKAIETDMNAGETKVFRMEH